MTHALEEPMKQRKDAGRATIVEHALTALLLAVALISAVEVFFPN